MRMRPLFPGLALLLLAAAAPLPVVAQTPPPQSCSDQAKAQNLTGNARSSFMSNCAKSQSNAPARSGTTQPPPAGTNPAAVSAGASAQYANAADASRKCPSDRVVWANTSSHVYHFSGNKNYGGTKQGAYMCQQDADRTGFHAAKNETPPAK